MARISFSALVEEIVGKLAGSVFQDSYGGFQIRTRVSPRNPQTKYQQLRRGEFGYLSAGWRFLTDVQRQTFIDAAVTPPAALNLYLQANINLTLIEEPTITDYVPSSDPGDMQIEFDTAEEGVLTVKATGATTVVPAGTKLLLQVTYQKAPTKIFTNPSQYSPIISFDEGTDLSVPTSILTEWQARYGVMLPNKKFCLSSALIDKSNGRRGATLINCTTVEEMPAYTTYAALLNQSSTSAPVATILQNGIGAIVWARTATGFYTGTLVGAFPANKTFLLADSLNVTTAPVIRIKRNDDDTIVIITHQSGAAQDGLLEDTTIEIRVYP